ncbi:MAG TPA: hypothetical protein VF101_02720 [Gaiellaceae bacterium]
MNEFLVELYVAKRDDAAIAAGWERFSRAAAEVTDAGRPVRLVRSIFVPEDETCFLLVEADADAVVLETARRASLVCERVVEAAIDISRNGTNHVKQKEKQ